MKNCWINLLAVYNILKEAFDKGWIDEFAKNMLEVELDGLDFITMPEDEPNYINYIKDVIKDLSERVENIEKQMKEDREEQLKKLNADLDYAKFCCSLVDGK